MTNHDSAFSNDELQLFEEIRQGKTFEATDTMPEVYRKNLTNLLLMQLDSEYAGGIGYAPWIVKAPSVHESVLVAQIVKDEMRHAHVIYRLLRDLGIDVEAHLKKNDYAFRVEDDLSNLGFTRPQKDYRVNIFYYPITYWTDFILFNFLMDRAAGHQLLDTFDSSYMPWKNSISGIYKEEAMHLAHGDKWIKILTQSEDPEDKRFLQERLNLWWPRVMNVFGHSHGKSNIMYVRLGLKKRSNVDIRKEFCGEIENMCQQHGLTLPHYDESQQLGYKK